MVIMMPRKPNPNRPHYSVLIGEARRSKGWTQKELALKVHLELTTIKKYETGERTPEFDELYDVCSVLGIDVYDAMELDLRKGGSPGFSKYIAKPFKDICSMIKPDIILNELSDCGYTDDDLEVILKNGDDVKSGYTSKMALILKAAAIKKRLQKKYHEELSKELTVLLVNIAEGKNIDE